MAKRFYPGVLERAAKNTFAVWFPDFPDCVAAGASQEVAIERAEMALAHAVDAIAERDDPLPQPTAVEAIRLPKNCRLIAFIMVGIEPPNPAERVNIYLPKCLLTRADRRAAELGMSRSSFFGLAINMMIGWEPGMSPAKILRPRSVAVRREPVILAPREKRTRARRNPK